MNSAVSFVADALHVPEESRRVVPIEPSRLAAVKPSYTTRFVADGIGADPVGWSLLEDRRHEPRAGEVILARVEKLGQHPRIELPDGRRAALFAGDEILVAYGNRYAPDQFEAELPPDLGPTNLVAAGGLAADAKSAHVLMGSPTQIRPLGVLCDGLGIVTLDRFSPYGQGRSVTRQIAGRPLVVAVVGTSMNSGKTTTVAAIVRGLRAAGMTVCAGKATGTGAGGDPQLFRDSGAELVLDFTDFGYPSTYLLDHADVAGLYQALVAALAARLPDAIVIEVADGIFQRETSRLIASPEFRTGLDHLVFAAGEAASAAAGCDYLGRYGLHPSVLSGTMTMSPLASREAGQITELPVLGVDALAHAAVAELLTPRSGITGLAEDAAEAAS